MAQQGQQTAEVLAASVQSKAHALALQDHKEEISAFGHLAPCRNIAPLEPPLKLHEYDMMERDTGK